MESYNYTGYTYQVVEDLFTWGYDLDVDFSEFRGSGGLIHIESRISKADGIINSYLYDSIYTYFSEDVTATVQITRISFPIIPIAIGSLIVGGIIVTAVIFNRFKKREKDPIDYLSPQEESDEDVEELLSDLLS